MNIDEQIKKYERKLADLKEDRKIGITKQVARQLGIGLTLVKYISKHPHLLTNQKGG